MSDPWAKLLETRTKNHCRRNCKCITKWPVCTQTVSESSSLQIWQFWNETGFWGGRGERKYLLPSQVGHTQGFMTTGSNNGDQLIVDLPLHRRHSVNPRPLQTLHLGAVFFCNFHNTFIVKYTNLWQLHWIRNKCLHDSLLPILPWIIGLDHGGNSFFQQMYCITHGNCSSRIQEISTLQISGVQRLVEASWKWRRPWTTTVTFKNLNPGIKRERERNSYPLGFNYGLKRA